MKRRFLLAIFLTAAFGVHPACAAADDAPDSTRIYRMNEVTVTGSRMAADVKRLPSPVSVLNDQAIDRSAGSSVSDLLQGQPGVFIKANGGSGSLQTISTRGMGPEYTLILVDGQRFTNYQNGQVDLGIFPIADVERIEVARGGYSSLFGADAVGGVVNIITKKPSPGLHASVEAGAGSFGFQQYQLSLTGGSDRLSVKGTYRNEHSANAFDCFFHDGALRTLTQRRNADYAISVADLAATLKSGETMSSTLSMRYTDADRGVPSSMISASSTNAERLLDHDYFTQYTTEWKPSVASHVSLHSNFHYWEQHYNDPLLLTGGKPATDFYINRSVMLTPQYDLMLGEGQSIAVGIEAVRASIVSSEIQSRSRTQLSAYGSSQHLLSFSAGLPFELTLYPSVRYDWFTGVPAAFDPKFGLNLGVRDFDGLRMRASVGKSYRVPTFNDLYWKTGGNPDLAPERSVSFDAGLMSTIQWQGIIDMEANYFVIDTRDRILWLPGANNLWTPKNISRVRSEGVELSVRWSLWDDAVSLGYSETLMSVIKKSAESIDDPTAGKQLPYLPEAAGSVDAAIRYAELSLNLRTSFNGERFSTEDNNPRYALDPFATLDVTVGYRFVFTRSAVKLKLEMQNLLNADYQIIALQPMPLREFRLSAELFY